MAWNRENVRGKTWDAFRQDQASCPGSDKSQLGFNFQEVASIYYLYRLSNVRWPKMWSLRSPKLNERLNVQPWSILITPYLIPIFYTKNIFKTCEPCEENRMMWLSVDVLSSVGQKSWRDKWPKSSAPNTCFVFWGKSISTLPGRCLCRVSPIQHFDWHGQDFCKYKELG